MGEFIGPAPTIEKNNRGSFLGLGKGRGRFLTRMTWMLGGLALIGAGITVLSGGF